MPDPAPSPGAAVAAVVARMTDTLAPMRADGDPARFFLGTYLRLTQAIGAALDEGVFEDPGWVAGWDVVFADLYLDALTAHRRDPAGAPAPWRLAFGARADLPPEAHVLLGVNAHVNYDQPQSLLAVIPPGQFDDADLLARRHRDHDRIDAVIAASVAREDRALQEAGGRRSRLDRVAAPVSRRAVRVFMAEARRKVWVNTLELHAARVRGPEHLTRRLEQLEEVAAARVADLLRPGPVLLRLAVRGFGVRLPAPPRPDDQLG